MITQPFILLERDTLENLVHTTIKQYKDGMSEQEIIEHTKTLYKEKDYDELKRDLRKIVFPWL